MKMLNIITLYLFVTKLARAFNQMCQYTLIFSPIIVPSSFKTLRYARGERIESLKFYLTPGPLIFKFNSLIDGVEKLHIGGNFLFGYLDLFLFYLKIQYT